MRARAGIRTLDLATFFTRAWQVRFAGILIALTALCVVTGSGVADSLQMSPTQRADSSLGNADARIQLPGSAPLGVDGRTLDLKLAQAVTHAGGHTPSIDYIASGVRPDGGGAGNLILEEVQHPESAQARLALLSGTWPNQVGEALVSISSNRQWPVGTEVRLFNGALRLQVVGTFVDKFATATTGLLIAPGTWSSLRSVDSEVAARLDEYAGRAVRWSGDAPSGRVLDAIRGVVADDPVANAAATASGGLTVESRRMIESTKSSTNVPLLLASVIGPIVAGLLAGLLAGAFIARTRTIMWTIGVPYRRTRGAAVLAMVIASAVGAATGAGVGLALAYLLRPLLASIATQELGPVTSMVPLFGVIPFAVLSAVAGTILAGPKRRSPARTNDAGAQAQNRVTLRIAGAVALATLGVFLGTGTNDVSLLSIAALAVSSAVIVACVPFAVMAVSALSPMSFASRLAFRKFSSERRSASTVVSAIAVLQVLGFTLSILVTSAIASVNNNSESSVPPGQIVFEAELDSQEDTDAARMEFEKQLGLQDAVQVFDAGAGSEREDGVTKILASVTDLERIIARRLMPEQKSLLEKGGSLLTKPLDGDSVTFPADGEFAGATLPAASIDGLDPSYQNIGGFVLESTAAETGLPTTDPSYVYTDITPHQQATAPAIAVGLDLNPYSVRVYRAPDELIAPLRVSAITIALSIIAGVMLLLSATSQAKVMRPELAGLRAVGVSSRFIAKTIAVRTGLTFVMATTFALIASSIGVAVAFSVAHLGLGITIPALPIILMVVSLAVFTAIAVLLATRRLRNTDWLT